MSVYAAQRQYAISLGRPAFHQVGAFEGHIILIVLLLIYISNIDYGYKMCPLSSILARRNDALENIISWNQQLLVPFG